MSYKCFHDGRKPVIGKKYTFLNRHGYDHQPESARKAGMVEGEAYTLRSFDIGDCSSTYEFEEFPGKDWNTVMFKEVK